MTTIVTRAGKGSPLTNTEVDTNFTNLNTAKIETLTSTDTSIAITGTDSSRNIALSNTAVTPAAYTNANITVDAQGRITAATSGSAGGVTTFNAGTTGFTPSTATTGAVTLAGTLALTNGGTGSTSAPQANATLMGWETTATTGGTTTFTNASSYQQNFTGSTTQTVVLPVTSTLALGWAFEIINNSSGSLTVNSSGGSLVGTVTAGTTASIVCRLTSGTTATSWDFDIDGFSGQTGTGDVVRASGPVLSSPTFTTPQATGQLAFQGSTSSSAQFATSQTSGNTTITTSQTSGTLTIGGPSGTGTQTFGRSTVSQQTDIQAGATASGSTKTMNIGTGGLAGSTTNIAIGSTAGTSTTNLQGNLQVNGAAGTSGQVLTSSGSGVAPTWTAVSGGQYFGSAAIKAIAYNSDTIAENITTTAGNNCLSVGPITIASGFSVTIASGQRWIIL